MWVLCVSNSVCNDGSNGTTVESGNQYYVIDVLIGRYINGSNLWYILKETGFGTYHHSSLFTNIEFEKQREYKIDQITNKYIF